MNRWYVREERKRDEHTGQWEVRFRAVAPDGQEFHYATRREARDLCREENRKT